MFYVYVLYSGRLRKRYLGSTENVEKRITEYNKGKNKFTKGEILWVVVYVEEFKTRAEAMQREKYLKSGFGRNLLDNMIKIEDIIEWKDG